MGTKNKAVNLGNHITLKSVSLDKQEIENNTAERNKYLLLTLENYGKALAKDHNHNILVYRYEKKIIQSKLAI